MIKFIENLLNVNDFEIENQTIFILRGEIMNRSVLIYEDLNNERILVEKAIIPSFKVINNILWVYCKGKTLEFFKKNDFSISNIYIDFFPKYKNEEIIIGDYKDGENRYLIARKTIDDSTIWKIDFTSTIFLICLQIYLVEFTKDLQKLKIVCFNFSSGLPLWHYFIPSGVYDWVDGSGRTHQGEILKFIGVYDDILWIVLNSGRLLGLSKENGSFIYDLCHPNLYPFTWSETNKIEGVNIYNYYTQLDEKQGKLFGLSNIWYWEINLKSFQRSFEIIDISATLHENGIERADAPVDYGWSFEGDEIYFGFTGRSLLKNNIGIFNRRSQKVTWSQKVGYEGEYHPILSKIEFESNRLYVLDGENTLHIFEKEN